MSASTTIVSDGVVYLRDSGERAPMSVVWTTLPGLSFICPPIGHVGIADSHGVTYDFSGPYQVTVGALMGGPAKRVWKLDPTQITKLDGEESAVEAYDAAVREGACVYGKRFHNIVMDNCHSHVALVLNRLGYGGRADWNQLRVFAAVWVKGNWVKSTDKWVTFGPWLFAVLVIVAVVVGVKVGS